MSRVGWPRRKWPKLGRSPRSPETPAFLGKIAKVFVFYDVPSPEWADREHPRDLCNQYCASDLRVPTSAPIPTD